MQTFLSGKQRTVAHNLQRKGYGWKLVGVTCVEPTCRWKGKRVWSFRMFVRPCPNCHKVHVSGRTSIWSPYYVMLGAIYV